MRRFVMAVALACVLSSTALAGLIPSTDVAPPPPPPEPSPLITIVQIIISAVV